jgi:signal transduction histidine kinase/ActR/RegA family two-component response regulator
MDARSDSDQSSAERAAIVVDCSDRIVLCDRGSGALLGRPSEDLVGSRLSDLAQGSMASITDALTRSRGTPRGIPVAATLPDRSQPGRTQNLQVIPLLGPGGDVAAELVLVERGQDAVGRAAPEAEREERGDGGSGDTAEMVPLSRRQQDEFLAMLAHELRSPLGVIMNALQVLMTARPGAPEHASAVQVADRQIRHQARLLNDLLDVSRVTLGKIELRLEPVELIELLRQTVESAGKMFAARAQEVTLQIPTGSLMTVADRTRLEQIVTNLLSNASKFTNPGGRIWVTLRADEDFAELSVKDTGIGMTPDTMRRAFDLFSQGDTSLARSHGGLGIGLTLVKRLVERHRGSVIADSAGPARGSRFTVRLPLGATPRLVAPSHPASKPRLRCRVLIIEDSSDARQMLRLLLEAEGHVVDEASDGARGVDLAMSSAPDVVLVDIGLPGLDGYEVARRIRRRLGLATRLVALTGYGDDDARRRAAGAGFDAHLVKPADPDELLRVLAGLVGPPRQARPA